MAKSLWKQRLAIALPSCCIILAGVFIILSTITIPAFLKATVADELKMVPDTYEYWGQSPGKADSVTNRNFTFFNFTNPRQFLYQNATPIFTAINGFLLQQNDNFTNLKYSEDMDEVFFNNWYFFTEINGTKSLQTKINTLNFGPLGFWYQLDLVGMPTFALQGFGGLYVELSQTFKTQAIGQGVNSQFLSNYSNWRAVCDNSQIPEDQCNNTWQDPQYGLSDQNNYQIWIEFGYFNDDSAENYLKSYFGYDDMQMQSLETIFYDWSDALNDILDNWFCNGTSCNSNYLTLLQLSSGQVTSNPPSGEAVDSICDTGNVTCIGQPQISKFLKNEFKKKFPQQKYQKLKFSLQTLNELLTPYRGTLLNIGNLTLLFETGNKFDSAQTLKQQDTYLADIMTQTHAETKDHAFVIWEWVKYFTKEFVIKSSKGGSQKNSGIGGVFSQAFYQSFTEFGDWIMEEYLNVLGEEQIKDCEAFVKDTISGIKDQNAAIICAPIKNKKAGYSMLFEPCFGSISKKEKFRVASNLKATEFAEYCDDEEKSFLTVSLQIHNKIFDQYSCNKNKGIKKCSPYELSLKQFMNSTVTLNPIENSIKSYPKSLTGNDWNQELAGFEYKNFLKTALGNQCLDSQVLTERQLIDLLSFDKLFSASMVMELMIENDPVNFEKLYYWKNMTLLKTFVKFVTVEVGFGGFIQERSVIQLLFGYEDPFLQGLKQTDTMMGGDPSINPIIMLSDPNITQQEAYLFPYSTYTGYSDIQKVRQYASLYGHRYITYNKTWYDGYDVKSEFVNPYRTQVPVNGTDSLQNPPNLDEKSSIYCLITSIYRTAKLDFSQNDQMFGMDLLNFRPSRNFLGNQQQVPYNHNYYQKFEGFHNVTFLGVPFHVSKNNFYSCPANWSQLVKVYDDKLNYEIKASIVDDTVLKVEPNTGTLFFGTVRLQTNYHFVNDILFSPGERMIPVTNIIREGAIDQSTVDQLLGDLRFALKMEKVLMILASIMIPLSLGFITYRCYVQSGKGRRQEKEINESLIQKDSLMTENVSMALGSNSGLTEAVRESRDSEDGARRYIQQPQQPLARRSKQEPKDKVQERIAQVDTIIFDEEEQEKKQPQQTMSVFANINGTIIDQE